MKSKKIHHIEEWITRRKLRAVCGRHGVAVYRNVRLTDLPALKASGLTMEAYRLILHSNLSFLVTDRFRAPLFIVNFDSTIRQPENDNAGMESIEKMCKRSRVPILRVRSEAFSNDTRTINLLTGLIQAWFSHRRADSPLPFPSHPRHRVGPSASASPTSFCPASQLRVANRFGTSLKKLPVPPSLFIGMDGEKSYHGAGWLQIDRKCGVLARATLRNHHLPISEVDLLSDLLCHQIFEKLFTFLMGQAKGASLPHIHKYLIYQMENLIKIKYGRIPTRCT